MRWSFVLASVFASTLAFAAGPATTWTVDPNHSSIVFKINHMGFANVYGFFPGLEGSIVLDEAKPEKTTFDVKVPVEKLTTFVQKRDDHLRSPDFFNVKQFPVIALKSKSVKKNGDKYEVAGELTLHGVTKPVNFTFHRMKTGKDPWGNTRTGGETSLKIKRSDFGMTFMNKPGEVGDEVELMIGLEAVQK